MLRSLGLVSLLALSGPALADGLNYNFIEAGYVEFDLDDDIVDVDGDGLGIGGSFEVGESMFVTAGYSTADFDFGIDLDQLSVGLGIHTPIADDIDLVGTISYVSVEASVPGVSADDDGFEATVGIRAMVSEAIELAGGVSYIDLSDSGDDTSFGGSAWYYFSDQFAIGIQAEFGDDVTAYGIGGRLYFGR